MSDPTDRPTFTERLGRSTWLLGAVALLAWFAMLWFMFGEVL